MKKIMSIRRIFKKIKNYLLLSKDNVKYLKTHPQKKMKKQTENQKVGDNLEETQQINSIAYTRNWAIKKINSLYKIGEYKNAMSIASEYDEWINISEDELEYLYIQDNDWSEEGEIDVI